MSALSLPLAGEARPEIQVYTGHLTGDLDRHLREVGRNKLASVLFPVARPKKLSCPAWGIPASTCIKGGALEKVEGAICSARVCYAKKARFLLDNVQAKLEQSYKFLSDPLWVPAAIHMINWESDDLFRLFMSGDVQSVAMMKNLITVAMHVRPVVLWCPTREREIVLACREEIQRLAPNLFIRASATMVDGPPPTWWGATSTVVTDQSPGPGVCPAKDQGGRCLDCRRCTDPREKNVAYRLS